MQSSTGTKVRAFWGEEPAPGISARVTECAIPGNARDGNGGFGVVSGPPAGSTTSERLELGHQQCRGGLRSSHPLRLEWVGRFDSREVESGSSTRLQSRLLPVVWDGEFWLPVGHGRVRAGRHCELTIDRMPRSVRGGPLGVGGSVSLLVRRVACEVLHIETEHPILAVADVEPGGNLVMQGDREGVSRRVAQAQRVLLLIHGILGDTLAMRRGVHGQAGGGHTQGIDDAYDLVLTFDYENLGTPIEQVAAQLRDRLAAVGLAAGHGKRLDVVAHSMGGLVARWFVERLDGSRVVNRLILCGTPSGGSPWTTVHDWALAAIGIGLNGLARVWWPAGVLGWLLALVERANVTLDQLRPGSDLLTRLAASQGPGCSYHVLAGDTALCSSSMAEGPGDSSRIRPLLERLFDRSLVHDLANPLFGSQPNDLAVSVESMCLIPGLVRREGAVNRVGCDHLTYFSEPASRKRLALALR